MPNTELFIDVLAHIELDPSSWEQDVWNIATTTEKPDSDTACGTSHCFAGWAVALSDDWKIQWDQSWVPGRKWSGQNARGSDGRRCSILDAANTALGIHIWDGDAGVDDLRVYAPNIRVYAPNNSLDDLYRYTAELVELTPEVLSKEVAKRIEEIKARA
jgi:hypothetical protein